MVGYEVGMEIGLGSWRKFNTLTYLLTSKLAS